MPSEPAYEKYARLKAELDELTKLVAEAEKATITYDVKHAYVCHVGPGQWAIYRREWGYKDTLSSTRPGPAEAKEHADWCNQDAIRRAEADEKRTAHWIEKLKEDPHCGCNEEWCNADDDNKVIAYPLGTCTKGGSPYGP